MIKNPSVAQDLTKKASVFSNFFPSLPSPLPLYFVPHTKPNCCHLFLLYTSVTSLVGQDLEIPTEAKGTSVFLTDGLTFL